MTTLTYTLKTEVKDDCDDCQKIINDDKDNDAITAIICGVEYYNDGKNDYDDIQDDDGIIKMVEMIVRMMMMMMMTTLVMLDFDDFE